MTVPCPDLPALREALTAKDLIEYLKTLPPGTLICTGQRHWRSPDVRKREHLKLHEAALWDPNTGRLFRRPEDVIRDDNVKSLLPTTLLEIDPTLK
jgi:hypothetical protein